MDRFAFDRVYTKVFLRFTDSSFAQEYKMYRKVWREMLERDLKFHSFFPNTGSFKILLLKTS